MCAMRLNNIVLIRSAKKDVCVRRQGHRGLRQQKSSFTKLLVDCLLLCSCQELFYCLQRQVAHRRAVAATTQAKLIRGAKLRQLIAKPVSPCKLKLLASDSDLEEKARCRFSCLPPDGRQTTSSVEDSCKHRRHRTRIC